MTDDTKLIQPIKYIHTHSSSYSAHDVIKIARPQEVCFATGSLKNHDSGNIDSMNDKMKLSVKKDFLSGYECENFLCDIIEEEDSLFLEIEPLHICISENNLKEALKELQEHLSVIAEEVAFKSDISLGKNPIKYKAFFNKYFKRV